MDINEILKYAVSKEASDIHLKVGNRPIIRINGKLIHLKQYPKLAPNIILEMGYSLMSKHQKEYYNRTHDLDMAYGIPGLGRFRVNVFQQKGSMGLVLRVIPTNIKSLSQLNMPKILEKIAKEERGLILVTGTTGSGKSTTLAAIIDAINTVSNKNIVTIEDPIEFLMKDKNSIINQRELGVDTISFAKAIKSALRQDPDVILVGEMRDFETIETAITAAETGHLVLSTLHTIDSVETINRIISVFPPHQQKQVRIQLSSILKAVVSQRLVPTKTGGRAAAVEVMITTARIKEMISDEKRTVEITDAIADGHNSYGMQTFDQALMGLVSSGKISYKDAMKNSSNPDDFALKFSGVGGTSNGSWKDFDKSKNKQKNIEEDETMTFDDDLIEDVEMISDEIEYSKFNLNEKPKPKPKPKKKSSFDFSKMDDLF